MELKQSKTVIEHIAWKHVAEYNKLKRANRNIDTEFNFGDLGKMSMKKLVEMFYLEIEKSAFPKIDYDQRNVEIVSEAKTLENLKNPKNPR